MRYAEISRRFEVLVAGVTLVGLLAVPLFRAETALASDGPITGQWIVERGSKPGAVKLTLQSGDGVRMNMTSSTTVSASDLRGLDWSQADSSGASVRFQIVRDAGTFDCEGYFKSGRGSGHYTFTPDESFAAELRGATDGEITSEKMLVLAVHDVGRAYVSELGALGYERIPFGKLVAMAIHGVSPDFVRGFNALGYERIALDKLIAMRIHGVTPDFASEMNRDGRMSLDKLVAFRIHGVSPDFTRELAALGYTDVGPEQLLAMRIHGVSPEFIREVQAEGYGDVETQQLVAMRIHGVSPEFIRHAKAQKGAGVSIQEMIRMRIMGHDDE